MEKCDAFLTKTHFEFDLCWVPAGSSGSASLFSVSDYLATLALLLVIYTISDFRSRHRLSLASAPVRKLIFWLYAFVFVFKATMELWLHQKWSILSFLDENKSFPDFGFLALVIPSVFYWLYVSYINPPVFSRWNCRNFFREYRRLIHNGTQEELRVALHDLGRSAHAIIRYASVSPADKKPIWKSSLAEGYAHDLLFLLGNRRLCAEMARTSPDTAAEFFYEIATQKKFQLPYDIFAKNIAVALLSDKSSPIFHEDSGQDSGWSGYVPVYSSEILSNPDHIVALAERHSSPLNVPYHIRERWYAENWEAYTRVALLYFKRMIKESPHWLTHHSVDEIFESCESMISDIYRLDGAEGSFSTMDECERLRVLVAFIRDLIDLLVKQKVPINSSLKPNDTLHNGFHEKLADLIFKVVGSTANVRHPFWNCWHINHNMVWIRLFRFWSYNETETWIFRRVCRLIYNEILWMDKSFNFRGAKYVGFCLNVLGLDEKRKRLYRREEHPLRLFVLNWVRKNYSRMREECPKVAESCLHGSITFDEKSLEFVKTYSNETGKFPEEKRFKVDDHNADAS